MHIKFAQFLVFLCVLKSVPSNAEHAIDHLKHISKHKIRKVHLSDISEGNYEAMFPKRGRSKIVVGNITELNEIYFGLKDSSQSKDPGLLWPNSPIYSIIEDDAYYIVTKINRPATIVISRVDGIEIPENPMSEGFFKIDKFSDFKAFQKGFILSLAESKSIHHSWIDEDIEIKGDLDSGEWKITKNHVNHKHKKLTYIVEWEPVVDQDTGDIYVQYSLFTKR